MMISVGIDISKGKSTICILKPYGEIISTPYELTHIETELSALVKRILNFNEETRVVMEATGGYHLPVLSYLKEHGIFVSVINPLVMKKYAAMALRKGKTDKIDAIKIANYGIDNWFRMVDYHASDELYSELRILGRQYSHYIRMQIESKILLSNMLDRTMPDIKSLLKSRSSKPNKDKLSSFVEEYWHYDNITNKSEMQFIRSYLKWAKNNGYNQNEAKAKKYML
ncbi:IS110 family transposase [Clostridium beijerinckii]|jgi:transposase|uniref:Transposase, IS111A/IS1328/IS1533 n=1 Tax=Clostridium beijerinckii (strain ATCC 51743 / NCIMB 8052) TaxID=290402 RepID=A6LYD5_CLOB8|nr:transposase, IS111A/IS1328/IS1533 [Clostridium beijerinckii NCIMB 8052]AIU03972.1 transposase, IS111A/IS1328/IS1533 [Clostridium beijerinckii ATCC 35702]NRT23226.1 transposase [Clostridium beijerinckii]NRT69205.1 transposase [Clostridium beijerinckii]NRT84646.1 transposase [Clostridium beijerinckii]